MGNESISERICAALPADVAARYRVLLTDTPTPASELRRELDEYTQLARTLAAQDDFSDLEHAEELIGRCRKLVDGMTADRDTGCAVTAAVIYLVSSDDAQSDAMSLTGMEDDEKVISTVERALLGR